MDLGIVGLPRSGKTSLFNAVTGAEMVVGQYSSQQETNVGVSKVPDPRLDELVRVFAPKKTTPAEIRWVDFPIVGFGPDGPGQRFVDELAGMDALVHVVRHFEDDTVPHPDVTIDAHRDIETLNLELTFADLALIERRLSRIESEMRSVKTAERGRLERDRVLLDRMREQLEGGGALRDLDFTPDEARDLATYRFVTRLPVLLIVNIGEDDLPRATEIEADYIERYGGSMVSVAALCARLEAELATLDAEEAQTFRSDLGAGDQSPRDRAIQAAYALLGLQSFLTAGEDECRAWTVPIGATAPEASGKIHSDLERGFIRAEVASWDELVDAGSVSELRKRGGLRTEGRDYVVQDGDVLNILFNV